jgi:hypothetical protein
MYLGITVEAVCGANLAHETLCADA